MIHLKINNKTLLENEFDKSSDQNLLNLKLFDRKFYQVATKFISNVSFLHKYLGFFVRLRRLLAYEVFTTSNHVLGKP